MAQSALNFCHQDVTRPTPRAHRRWSVLRGAELERALHSLWREVRRVPAAIQAAAASSLGQGQRTGSTGQVCTRRGREGVAEWAATPAASGPCPMAAASDKGHGDAGTIVTIPWHRPHTQSLFLRPPKVSTRASERERERARQRLQRSPQNPPARSTRASLLESVHFFSPRATAPRQRKSVSGRLQMIN